MVTHKYLLRFLQECPVNTSEIKIVCLKRFASLQLQRKNFLTNMILLPDDWGSSSGFESGISHNDPYALLCITVQLIRVGQGDLLPEAKKRRSYCIIFMLVEELAGQIMKKSTVHTLTRSLKRVLLSCIADELHSVVYHGSHSWAQLPLIRYPLF